MYDARQVKQLKPFMVFRYRVKVMRPAPPALTAKSPSSLVHIHRVIWLGVIGSIVIIALRRAVLLLQPGGLKKRRAH